MLERVQKRAVNKVEDLATNRPVLLSVIVVLCVASIVMPLSLPYYLYDWDSFRAELMAEFHGTIVDVGLIGGLFLWFGKLAERRQRMERYRDEIEDMLGWKSQLASLRIASNIRRLNRVGITSGLELMEAHLEDASLSGAQLSDSELWGANLEHAKLREANLDYANLAGADLEEADLEQCSFKEADLRGTDLRNADLERAILDSANLSGSDAGGADLQYASLRDANLERIRLNSASLRGADLYRANLQRSYLKEVNLMAANLRGANLSNSNLWHAHLAGSDLTGANITGANLEGANLTSATLPAEDDFSVFEDVATLYRARFDKDVKAALKERFPHHFEDPEKKSFTDQA